MHMASGSVIWLHLNDATHSIHKQITLRKTVCMLLIHILWYVFTGEWELDRGRRFTDRARQLKSA